jgi:putative transposase
MTAMRPGTVAVGNQVRVRGVTHTVARLAGGAVVLVDVVGREVETTIAELLVGPDFEVVASTSGRVPLPARGVLEGLSPEAVEKACWWERHVVEVLHGVPPDAGRGAVPRPEYDPDRTSLRQRETSKLAELARTGSTVPLSSFQRMRRAYERQGLLGLVDRRTVRQSKGMVDQRVVDAIRTAISRETDRSTGTVSRLQRQVQRILAEEHDVDPATVMPSRATFYRLVERISTGRHTFGSAPTRRSLAQQPAGPFGAVTVVRPGEWLMVDSTPLDVRVVLDDGTVDRADLTWMIDVATRTIPAAVLRPTTKSVDASLLLARCLTPEPMRPGWTDALRMSRSVLPYRRLLDLDARLEHAAARPVIVPETMVCDHGNVYQSAAFRAACRSIGATMQPTHKGSPWEKGEVERSFASVASLFAQYVKGYVGRSVDRRGKNADAEAVWSIGELQALLDEWLVACWQNRPHDGLRHPLTPGRALTPNEQYAALVEIAGYVPVSLSTDDYIELLPMAWRVINSDGIKIDRRRYDAKTLNPYRRQGSGDVAHRGLWEVHHDPYDVTRIWVRNHHDGGWLTVPWTHLATTPVPFGEQAWAKARQILARRGQNNPTEAEIAAAVNALLDKAEAGPQPTRRRRRPDKHDRRVAARTRATNQPSWPRPQDDEDPSHPAQRPADREPTVTEVSPDATGDDQIAEVIPLGIFDARQEAKKWW